MAAGDDWDTERLTSSSPDSNDSPILSYRYEKYRRCPSYTTENLREEGREGRSTVSTIAKFFLFCVAMILFCVLMYIPVYNKANYHVPKAMVAGWAVEQSRDTRLYINPNKVTTKHEPKNVCPKHKRHKRNNLFLLIVVCSATTNFERRVAIRETWANYKKYKKNAKVFNEVIDMYKNYNYSYDLMQDNNTNDDTVKKNRRDISRYKDLVPELVKILNSSVISQQATQEKEDVRSEEEQDGVLPEFDMNEVLGEENNFKNYGVDYESDNIMKIPPKGAKTEQDSENVLKLLQGTNVLNLSNALKNLRNVLDDDYTEDDSERDFRFVFLLGLPPQDINVTEVQLRIDSEANEYGDIIQETFVDSYNNLTLKSIMMLKWVTNNCKNSIRYILKTDDDMFINVPNLINNLKNRSRDYDNKVATGYKKSEYLLIGALICGAKPVQDATNKWYSPHYMYSERVYPRYLSGTGYALSADTASALYAVALKTNYFHLEDVFITGICSARAKPRIMPKDEPLFAYHRVYATADIACVAHSRATAHQVSTSDLYKVISKLGNQQVVDWCERDRLTQVRRERRRQKKLQKLKRRKTVRS